MARLVQCPCGRQFYHRAGSQSQCFRCGRLHSSGPGASFPRLLVLLLGLLFFGGPMLFAHGDWSMVFFLGGLAAAAGAYLGLASWISRGP